MRLLSRLSLRFPKTTLTIGLLLTVGSFFLIRHLQIRTNLSDLLPDNHPIILQGREIEKVVGGASFIVVTVETQKPLAAAKFLSDLHQKLLPEVGNQIRYIDDRPPVDFFKKYSLLYLSLNELDDLFQEIQQKIDRGKIRKAGLDLRLTTENEDFLTSARAKYSSFLQPYPYYQNPEGTLFVSLIKPDWRTTEVDKTEKFVEELQKTIRGLNPFIYDSSLNIRLTGPYIKQMSQKKIVFKDAAIVSLASFIGSIAYLIFHFRKKRAVFLVGIPLVMSTMWALSLAYFLFGSLNLFSSVLCGVLLGLSADYGIYVYSEYHRQRRTGLNAAKALQEALTHLGGAFLAASSTTAAAFFSLAFTRFKALHEFGILAGIGIALCAFAFIFFFPPLTLLLEKWRPEKIRPVDWGESRQKFSHAWIQWVFSKRNLIVVSLFLLLPIGAVVAGHLRFDYNLNHIMAAQDTKELDKQVDAIFNHSVNPEVALTANAEDARALADSIRTVQANHAAKPEGTTIRKVISLPDFVPDDQDEKIKRIEKIRSLFTPDVLKGMSFKEIEDYRNLSSLLHPSRFSLEDVPETIKKKFKDREGHLGRILFIFPNFEMTHADRFLKFAEELRQVECTECSFPFFIAGESSIFSEIIHLLFRDGRLIMGFTLVMILGALFLNFRSIRSTLIVFSPLAVGLLALFGWMALTGLSFNIVNLAAVPIILGTADDYAVHFYQRFKNHPHAPLGETYRMVFRPLLGAALTTLIGFGSLLFAQNGGVRTFGLLCVLGIFLCALTTLVWFPAFLSFMKQKKLLCLSGLILIILVSPLLSTRSAEAYSSVNVPIDDTVYRDLDKLIAAGLIKSAIYGQRPWSRNEVARIIKIALKNYQESPQPNSKIESLLEELQQNFRDELSPKVKKNIRGTLLEQIQWDYTLLDSPSRPIPPHNGIGGIEADIIPLTSYKEGRHFTEGNTLGLETTHWTTLSRFLSFYARPRFELLVTNTGSTDVNPIVQQLYGKFAYKNFELEAGRDSILWGQGEFGGGLLSNNARPLDMIRIGNQSPFRFPWIFKYIGPSKFNFFVANLGPERSTFPYGYIVGGKGTIKPASFLEFSLGQLLMVGGDGVPSINAGDVFLDFFGIKPRGSEDREISSRLGTAEARFFLPWLRNTQIYLELIVDDILKESYTNTLIDRIYYLSGIYIPRLTHDGSVDLRIEYKHFPGIAYRHGLFQTGWSLNRRLLADELGPDSDGVYLSGKVDVTPSIIIPFRFAFEIRDSDDFVASGSGDVVNDVRTSDNASEQRIRIESGFSWKLNKKLKLDVEVGYENVQDFNFTPEDTHNFKGAVFLRFFPFPNVL